MVSQLSQRERLQAVYVKASRRFDAAYKAARPDGEHWSINNEVMNRYIMALDYRDGVEDAIYAAGYRVVRGEVRKA